MNDPQKKRRDEEQVNDPLFSVEQVASATECTGALPAQIATEEEARAIAGLQAIHPPHPRFVDGNDEH